MSRKKRTMSSRTSETVAEPRVLTFSVEGTQGLRKAFGVFVTLIAMLPTTIVAVQWIEYSLHGGTENEPSTGAGAIVPGLLLALWGFWQAVYRASVTFDPFTRKIEWRVTALGFVFRKWTWTFDEVTAIEFRSNSSYRLQGSSAFLTCARESREILGYFHSQHLPPPELEEVSGMLGLPLPNEKSDGS